MLLSLSDLGIEISPVYIHKIDRRSFWESTGDIEQRANNAVTLIFKDPEYIYSFWRINSDLDLCCVAASLNARRGSPEEEIDFIWLTDSELNKFDLVPEQINEGKCLHAEKLHYNIVVSPVQAKTLCRELMLASRSAYRYKKKHMRVIVPSLRDKGCKVYETELEICSCESLSAD